MMNDIRKPDYKSSNLLNLRETQFVRIPLIKIGRFFAISGLLLTFLINPTVYAPVFGQTIVQNNSSNQETSKVETVANSRTIASRQEELENELADLEQQIKEQQQIVSNYRAQGKTLQNEIGSLDAQIRSINLQIQAVEVSLQRLDQDIYQTQGEINTTQNKIESHKEALSASVRNLYENENETILAILLKNGELSDFFSDVNNLLLVQDTINKSLYEIVELRQQLIAQKEELNLERGDVESLKIVRENSRKNLESVQTQKEQLLAVTKNEESRYQEILEETQKTASQIRSQIFTLIGGGELTFETAYELAKLSEGNTGIRAALTMAIMSRESGFGSNVGQCHYENAMHPDRDIAPFLAITNNLGVNPDSTVAKVSCALSYGWGGAMGPAQFIPSTWAIYGGYRNTSSGWRYNENLDYIGDIVGRKPSNPWSNADAFTATSLYIKELYESRTCQSYADGLDHRYQRQELLEECAAARYYAGGNWRKHYSFYGIPVVQKANEFQRDIDVLES